MKHCIYLNNPTLKIVSSFISAIILFIYVFFCVIKFWLNPILLFLMPLLLFILGSAVFSVGSLALYFRKYEFTSNGLRIQFLNFKPRFYTWNDIKEIGICKVHYQTRPPYDYLKVFRCVLEEEKIGPKNGYGIWATEIYHVFHMRAIIIMDFSYVLQEQLEKDCPDLIADYLFIKKNANDKY